MKRCIDKRTRQAFAVKEIAYDTAKRRDEIEQEIKVSSLISCCPDMTEMIEVVALQFYPVSLLPQTNGTHDDF